MHRYVQHIYFLVHVLELNCMHNVLYLCHQPNSRQPAHEYVFHCTQVHVLCVIVSVNVLLQYAFFNDIDFYYCFHFWWATILWHTFFLVLCVLFLAGVIRKWFIHNIKQWMRVECRCILLGKSEWINRSLMLNIRQIHTLNGPIWHKMSDQILFEFTHTIHWIASHSSKIASDLNRPNQSIEFTHLTHYLFGHFNIHFVDTVYLTRQKATTTPTYIFMKSFLKLFANQNESKKKNNQKQYSKFASINFNLISNRTSFIDLRFRRKTKYRQKFVCSCKMYYVNDDGLRTLKLNETEMLFIWTYVYFSMDINECYRDSKVIYASSWNIDDHKFNYNQWQNNNSLKKPKKAPFSRRILHILTSTEKSNIKCIKFIWMMKTLCVLNTAQPNIENELFYLPMVFFIQNNVISK